MKKLALAVVISSLLGTVAGCSKQPETQSSTQSEAAKPAAVAKQTIPGVTFIEEVKAEPGKIVIPYKKYQLDNGLTVVIHQDHSDPLAHVDVTYHVGSAREELGKSGFAHFFEHMMFQGSEHVADEEHFKIVTELGGELNGTTNTDRTNYFQTVPANHLETMLWLEADRMGFLLDAVTQPKFEVQRETVKNERGQRVDNRPYGRVNERVIQAMYPEGHPYSWPVIGYMEDLNRVNVNDLKAFFLRWYGPNNATLTVGGDVEPEKVLKMVTKYFGPIPRGPEVNKPEAAMVSLSEDRYISMEDNVHLPLLYLAFPTVAARHEDEAPLDILAEILGGDRTSLLYKNLVKNQLAVQAQVSHPCAELACRFTMYALPHPASGKSLTDMEKIIRDSLDEFEKRGVQDDDLTKVKATMESRNIFGLQSVRGKVSTLAANETFTGNPNYIEQDVARYNNVTKEDVMRVFKKYIKDKKSVVLSVVPNGKLDTIARADNFKVPERTFGEQSATTADSLQVRKVTNEPFDRSKRPGSGQSAAVSVPDFWKKDMSNGIEVLGSVSSETPTTSILINVPAGHYYTSTDKAGLAELTASMLDEATKKYSVEQMSQELSKLGSDVSISAGNNYININVNTLTKNLDATMALVEQKMFEPAFNEEDFNRLRKQMIEGIKNSMTDASYLANAAYNKLMFGDNIAGKPRNGTLESLESITLDDVKAYYATHFKPHNTQMIVVSDLDQQKLSDTLKGLDSWAGKGPELKLDLPMPLKQELTIYLVNKDKAAQSAIRIGKRGMKRDISGEFYQAGLMNYALGGNFNSRINLNLREDKGYTYGARTRFWGDKLAGGFTASASVRADATDKSIIEFVNEIKSYHSKGTTADELAFMRSSINERDALAYETPQEKLRFLAQILEYDLTPAFVDDRSKIRNDITAEQINELAKRHLNIEDMTMVVVGDAATLKPKLAELGYPVKELKL